MSGRTTNRRIRVGALVALAAGWALAASVVAPALGTSATRPSGSGRTSSTHQPVTTAPDGSPPAPAVGSWTVVRTGASSYRLTWTAPFPLRTGDARPQVTGPDSADEPATTISANARRVSAVVTSATPPDPADYDITLAGRSLDDPQRARARGGAAALAARRPPTRPLGDDPGVVGPYRVVTSDYRLAPVKLPRLPARVEMLGHVVRPRHADPADPLVLFLHGRHDACYQPDFAAPSRRTADWPCGDGQRPVPSYLGYDYVQRLLASQGYVTVSISADGINAQDYRASDGGATDRALLVRRHLAQWAQWSDDGRYAVDMSRVILVGHSRGGEGVNRASLTTPLSAPYTIAGQVLVAPTDFGYQGDPYIPTVTLLPYCDGDVSDLEGQYYADVSRDLVDDDTALHSSVLVMGANHNFYNTEWTPHISAAPSFDDWGGPPHATCGRKTPARLSPLEQRKVGRTYIAGAVHLFARHDTRVLPMFDGSAVSVASAGDADVRSEAVGAGRVLRIPGADASVAPGATATTRLCVGRAGGDAAASACGSGIDSVRTPHWVGGYPPGLPARTDFEMAWSATGQRGGIDFTEPLDLSTAASLDLRTIVDPEVGDVQLWVRLHDGDGDTLVRPLGAGRVPALPRGDYSLGKYWAQTLRVPLAAIPAGQRDRVTGIDLVARNSTGHVWILDAAAVPAGLPAVPRTRLPVVTLHNATQVEGDGGTLSTISVPYTVSGESDRAGRLRVLIQDGSTGRTLPGRVLTIPPHSTGGSIDVPYRANSRDDLPKRTSSVAAFATHDVAVGGYLGAAVIVDDDPAPAFRVAPFRPMVHEGTSARWTVRLSTPTNYFLDFRAKPVRGTATGKRLTVGDLPRPFRRSHLHPVPPLDTPLWKTDLEFFVDLPPGSRSGRLVLPTRRDARVDPSRVISMRFHAFGHGLTSQQPVGTVRVRD